jgi:hypothetical protein
MLILFRTGKINSGESGKNPDGWYHWVPLKAGSFITVINSHCKGMVRLSPLKKKTICGENGGGTIGYREETWKRGDEIWFINLLKENDTLQSINSSLFPA